MFFAVCACVSLLVVIWGGADMRCGTKAEGRGTITWPSSRVMHYALSQLIFITVFCTLFCSARCSSRLAVRTGQVYSLCCKPLCVFVGVGDARNLLMPMDRLSKAQVTTAAEVARSILVHETHHRVLLPVFGFAAPFHCPNITTITQGVAAIRTHLQCKVWYGEQPSALV
jgi:hypothetical protein